MRYYELLYIVNPNLEDERVNGIIEELGNEINKYGVNIINHHIWGKKRLAYPVKNNKYGIYILLQFAAEKFDFLKEFERFLILSKTVIRHQIVRLEEEPKKVESLELENDDDSGTKEEKTETSEESKKDGKEDESDKKDEVAKTEKTDEEPVKEEPKVESKEEEIEGAEEVEEAKEEKVEEEASDDVEEKKEEEK